MSNYKIETKELILKQNQRASGIETFVYEPSTVDEEVLGNLYIIGWLKNSRQDLSFIPNVIASVIRREFYKQSVTQDAYAHFEFAIQKANEAFKDVAKTNKNVLEDVGICAVNIVADKIRFSFIGECTLLLFRDGELIRMNEASSAEQKDSDGTPDGFANIVNGDIEENDKFIFSTFAVMDLFSDTGIAKLFQLPQNEQADIVTKIYQKNSKDTPLPDQAAILLEVKAPKIQGVLAFTKVLRAKTSVINPQGQGAAALQTISVALQKMNPKVALKKAAAIRPHRNAIIISGIVFAFMLSSFIGIAIYAKLAILAEVRSDTAQAESLIKTSKDEAAALLEQAQRMAFPLLSVWYTHNSAVALLDTINKYINRAHNIYIDPPVMIGTIPIASVKFSPQYIFDDARYVYVYGQDPSFFYRLDKATFQSSFTFTATSTKQLAQNAKKTQNKRDMPDALYALSPENNKILKHSKLSTITETFLLGSVSHTIDFTVSADNNSIYLLTQKQLFVLQNSK